LKKNPGENAGEWAWDDNPFTGTRELNGLRTLMAVMNNWDLKDENNAVYEPKEKKKHDDDSIKDMPEYAVSDLGASFGANHLAWPFNHSRGDLQSYRKSKFIKAANESTVDFYTPSRPSFVYWFGRRQDFHEHARLSYIGQQVPRADAKWMG
jgi:hypothetical protein